MNYIKKIENGDTTECEKYCNSNEYFSGNICYDNCPDDKYFIGKNKDCIGKCNNGAGLKYFFFQILVAIKYINVLNLVHLIIPY